MCGGGLRPPFRLSMSPGGNIPGINAVWRQPELDLASPAHVVRENLMRMMRDVIRACRMRELSYLMESPASDRCSHALSQRSLSPRGLQARRWDQVTRNTRLMRSVMVAAIAGVALLVGPAVTGQAPQPAARVWLAAPVPLDLARPFDGPAEPWLPGHRGVDLHAQVNQTVVSPGSGVVTFAGTVVDRSVVVVQHPNGLRSSLEPVDALVGVGDAVEPGQAIGTLQDVPGHCAPHACVHWGVRRGDDYVDPLDVLTGFGPIRLLPLHSTALHPT